MASVSLGKLIAANIRAWRGQRDLAQATVYARMQALGFTAWHRQTISAVERGDRRVTAEELYGLALCLEVSLPALTATRDPDVYVELPNGYQVNAESIERLAGRGVNDHAVQWPEDGTRPWVAKLTYPPGTPRPDPFDREVMGPAMAAQGWPESVPVPPREEGRTRPPVVAVIVTSPKGVLITKRRDGKPPWGFVSGELEPDEQAQDAAVRETKEETGLEVRAREEIGRRVHPSTGRTMIYLAAKPVRGTKVFVGDDAELSEVRWVSFSEADQLMPDMFPAVRAYLEQALKQGSTQS